MADIRTSEGFEEIKAFIERMKESNGAEVQGVQFPPGVDEYMRDRVLAGDIETVSFMHRLAWVFGVQVGQASAQFQNQPNHVAKRKVEA
jgi:hypothetical protein